MRLEFVLRIVAAAAIIVLATVPAWGGTDTDTFTVSAKVLESCSVTADDLDFGDYDPVSATPLDAETTIDVTCTNGTGYDIALNKGIGAGATIAARKMSDGAQLLTYSLYTDVLRSALWGEAGAELVSATGAGAQQSYDVYGRVPINQTAEAGDYEDTVTVTVSLLMRAAPVLFAALMLAAPAAAAQTSQGLQVSPVIVQMAAERPISSFRLRNGRGRETAFEVAAFAWSQENGETRLAPTDALVAAPSVFLVPAGGERIVRLGVRPDAQTPDREQGYRIVLRELPPRDAPPGFRLLVEMSMPVFVTPRGARGSLAAERAFENGPAIRLVNTGASHVKLEPIAKAPDLPRYLLAGASVVRPFSGGGDTLSLVVADASAEPPRTMTIAIDDAPVLADLRLR